MKNKYFCLLIERSKHEDNQGMRLTFSPIDIDQNKSLEELYKYLKCTNIDIQERIINGKVYDFIFDGEYLINGKADNTENAVAIGTEDNKPIEIIFGNLIICGQADNEGRETSLKENDIENILLNGRSFIKNKKLNKVYEMITYTF